MSTGVVEHRELAGLVADLLAAVDGIVPASARHDLEEGRRRLEEERVNLVVLGEFKRGKSTLVNALLSEDVVPTGVLPLTAAVIVVRYGERPDLLVTFDDGARHEAPLTDLDEFATEAGNPGNRRGVQLLTIELPAKLLGTGVQLVDTPGIGSVFSHNTETARGFLGQVDAALFTLAADQPLSGAEEELVREAAGRLPRIFFALNKIDRLEEGDRAEVEDFVRRQLQTLLGEEPELFPLSARTGEGLDALRLRLEGFATEERERVLAGSVRALAATFATEALQALRFEAHAVELPLVELEQKLADFRARAEHLSQTREEAAELLRQGARRVVTETVNEPLLSLAGREGPAFMAELEAFAAAEGKLAPRRLAARLEDWIDRAIAKRFDELARDREQQIARDLEALHQRYSERVDRLMRELDDAADDVFGTRVGRLVPAVELRRPSRFTFKLHDVEREMLDQLASAAAAAAPGALGRRLVLREAEERLKLLLDRHAGRLRSDLATRIDESVGDYERELAFVVREQIGAVEAAVDRAAREQRGGKMHVAKRLAELRDAQRQVGEIERALTPGSG